MIRLYTCNGDIMREYNLFIIKEEFVNSSNKRELFKTLKRLYVMSNNYNYGICMYEQVCEYVNVNVLRNYLCEKYSLTYNDYFFYRGCKIKIRHSRIVIMSRCNLPNILRIFNLYNKNIFVCDFDNNDYFFLNDIKEFFLLPS